MESASPTMRLDLTAQEKHPGLFDLWSESEQTISSLTLPSMTLQGITPIEFDMSATQLLVESDEEPQLPVGSEDQAGSTIPHSAIWELVLPGRLSLAKARLGQRLANLEQAQRALPWLEQRLEYFTAYAPALEPPAITAGQGGVARSYALAAGDRAIQIWQQMPEARLQSWLWEQQVAGVQYAAGALDYASVGDFVEKIKNAFQRVDRLARKFNLLLAPTAWVCTRPKEHLLATTRIDWSGHLHTYLAPEADREVLDLHQASLQAFLVERQIWLRIGILTVANTLKLAVRLPGGWGVVATIPGILDFIEQVIEQFRQLESGSR